MQYLPYTFIIVSRIISNKQLAVAVLITRLFRSRLTKFHNDSLGRLYSQTDKLQTPRPKHIHTSSFVGRFCRFLTSYALECYISCSLFPFSCIPSSACAIICLYCSFTLSGASICTLPLKPNTQPKKVGLADTSVCTLKDVISYARLSHLLRSGQPLFSSGCYHTVNLQELSRLRT